jgi:two-component system NtrC family sensor kinase
MKRLIYIFFSFLFVVFQVQAQTKQIDSLKQLLSQTKADTTTYDILRLISWNSMWSYSDTALSYAQKALLLANHLNDPPKESEALLLFGTAWSVIGNYPLAIDYLLKGIRIEEQFKTVRTNDVWPIPVLQLFYYNISDCYRDLGDYENALNYYGKSIKIPSKNADNILMESFWHLSRIYEKFNHLDSALLYAKRALDLDIKMHGKSERSPIPIALGNIYYKMKNYADALYYYHIAERAEEDNFFLKDVIETYNGIAMIYARMNLKDSAIWYARKALKLQSIISFPLGELKSYSILSDIYRDNKQWDSVVRYMEQSFSLQSKLFSQQNEREIQNLSFSEKLREQELIASQRQYRSKILTYAAFVIAFIMLFTAIVLFRNIQHRKKAFILLQQQKQETDRQKEKVESTLLELKSTQSQLIQSEKMASLGELTAGIAHEIQNPLNFVNNFSEVNTELIDEAGQEIDKGNISEAKTILNDIKENEEKINHHGKRADAIVKGMLQHSRSSSGVKEPADINALAGEYLRLSYHGMKAKDKSFNATLKTDFEENIVKIDIIPQDIGRVLLNLYNNAFYAVSEKKKQGGGSYEPTVSVSTKRINAKVEIRVGDNGNGIPQKVLDKIFQPFFTTKPTGQGTGLGLSLSYDIIKAHGGKLIVETKEGEGAEFMIQLPIR